MAPAPAGASVKVQETKADLEALAVKLNPVVGFYDPLGLADADFWGRGNEYTIGWLRQAEIKHGRVAMAGFVGYCLHANGVQFPIHIPGDYTTKSPAELWDQARGRRRRTKREPPRDARRASARAGERASSARVEEDASSCVEPRLGGRRRRPQLPTVELHQKQTRKRKNTL